MAGILVHEWVESSGGAELVLEQLAEAFPDAARYCLWNDAPERRVSYGMRESWLARTPLRRSKALALPLMPATWRYALRDRSVDYAVVSSHLFAHHVRFPAAGQVPTFVYAHTPARYVWTPELDGRGTSAPARAASSVLKRVDRAAVNRDASFAANSAFIARRMADAWGVEARVIHPPVAVERLTAADDWAEVLDADDRAVLDALPRDFLLGASRFVPYKRLDWVVRAGEACGVPVVIAGSGPQEDALRALAAEARVPVHVLHRPSDDLLAALYQRALAYVFPPVEDFGIMPVEALAAGAVVIANALGGAAETVTEGVDGRLFHGDSLDGLVDCVRGFLDSPVRVDPRRDRAAAYARFSEARFRDEVRRWVGPVAGHRATGSPAAVPRAGRQFSPA